MVSLKSQIRWCVRAQLALGGALLLIGSSFYFLGYRPTTAKMRALDADVQNMQKELRDNTGKSTILPTVAAEVKGLRVRLDGAKKLPRDMDIAGFIQDVTRVTKNTQLPKPQYKPDNTPKRGELFSLYGIQLQIQGNFTNVFSFIRETELLPRLSRMRSIKIQSDPKEPGVVTVNLGMDLYFSPE